MTSEEIVTKSVPRFLTEQKGLTGFETPKAGAYQTVRELIENSLDSVEQARVLPEITLSIKKDGNYYEIVSVDNGLGLHDSDIPKAFGTVLTSSKYNNRQDRGMFGLGVKTVLLNAQVTTNYPFSIASSRYSFSGKFFPISKYKLKIDLNENKPEKIDHKQETNRMRWHGFAIKFKIGNVNFDEAKKDILAYLSLTHVICPYATIKFSFEKEVYEYKSKTKLMPKPPKTTLFHPYDIDFLDFENLAKTSKPLAISEFLQKYFQRVGKTTAEQFCKFVGIRQDRGIQTFKHDELYDLKQKMSEFTEWQPPSVSALSLIEEECFKAGVKELSKVDFFAYSSRRGISGGSAFAIEVCAVIDNSKKSEGKNGDSIVVRRIVNKIPLIEDYKSCLLRNVFDDINWLRYNFDTNDFKITFYVHLCSSSKRTLFKDLRKGIIADIPEIRKTLDLTIKEVLRKIQMYASNREKTEFEQKKINRFMQYIPIMTKSLSFLTKEQPENVKKLLDESLIHEGVKIGV